MSFETKWRETRAGGLVGAAVATVLGLIFLIYGVGQGLSNMSYNLPFAVRPDIVPTEVVIIYMDEDSHSALKQPYDQHWNRTNHALLLQRLKAASAKAVAFDVLFDEPHPEEDRAFIQAIVQHGKVVVGAKLSAVGYGGSSFEGTKRPIPEIQQVAAWGVAEGTDADEIVRRHYAVASHSTNIVSMAWRTAELAHPDPIPELLSAKWLNYYGPPGTIPWVSYVQVLNGAVPQASLSNKVAFVGARIGTGFTGGKGTDDFRTPYSAWTGTRSPGVEVNATAYLNLHRREWLRRPSAISEFLLVVGVGVLFGMGLNFFRPLPAALISCVAMLVVFSAACLLLWQEQVWFTWAVPVFVQIPCAAVCAFVARTQRLHREKQALEEKLATRTAPGAVGPVVAAAPSPIMGSPSPSVLMRRQMCEMFHTPSPGRVLNDDATLLDGQHSPIVPDCALLRCIGSGAYGEVWLGTTVLGAYRAIKLVYRRNFLDDRPYEREFEGIKHFDPFSRNHPGLVHVLHVGRNDADGYFYYLMELADDLSATKPFDPQKYDAKTLGKELQARGRLSVEECVQIALNLTDSLAYLHENGLIHRDIKPSNLIFVEGKPKLADIGLVTQIGDGRSFVGTEGYYPPEGPGSPAGDIFSLGKVLYETVTGLNRQRFPDLPTNLKPEGDLQRFMRFNRIILKACEHNLRKRYASAREMHEDLLRLTIEKPRLLDFFKKGRRAKPANEPR